MTLVTCAEKDLLKALSWTWEYLNSVPTMVPVLWRYAGSLLEKSR